MWTFKSVRSGIVIVDPEGGMPQRVIVLQFNPDALECSISPQAAGAVMPGVGGVGEIGTRRCG